MTDRYAGYVVTLEEDVRDDADQLLAVIRNLKGVQSVEPIKAIDVMVAEIAAHSRVRGKVTAILHDTLDTLWDRKPVQHRD